MAAFNSTKSARASLMSMTVFARSCVPRSGWWLRSQRMVSLVCIFTSILEPLGLTIECGGKEGVPDMVVKHVQHVVKNEFPVGVSTGKEQMPHEKEEQ
jgi:hypothetical protein